MARLNQLPLHRVLLRRSHHSHPTSKLRPVASDICHFPLGPYSNARVHQRSALLLVLACPGGLLPSLFTAISSTHVSQVIGLVQPPRHLKQPGHAVVAQSRCPPRVLGASRTTSTVGHCRTSTSNKQNVSPILVRVMYCMLAVDHLSCRTPKIVTWKSAIAPNREQSNVHMDSLLRNTIDLGTTQVMRNDACR